MTCKYNYEMVVQIHLQMQERSLQDCYLPPPLQMNGDDNRSCLFSSQRSKPSLKIVDIFQGLLIVCVLYDIHVYITLFTIIDNLHTL